MPYSVSGVVGGVSIPGVGRRGVSREDGSTSHRPRKPHHKLVERPELAFASPAAGYLICQGGFVVKGWVLVVLAFVGMFVGLLLIGTGLALGAGSGYRAESSRRARRFLPNRDTHPTSGTHQTNS